jgi:superfamily II DNA helicase RecQ
MVNRSVAGHVARSQRLSQSYVWVRMRRLVSVSSVVHEGAYHHVYVVSPEQLQPLSHSHITRMCQLSNEKKFTKHIKVIHVDEAQSVWVAGVKKYGQEAFRPAYGKLDEWRINLNNRTCFQLLSATLPPSILEIVKSKVLLSSDHRFIKISSNRPNIVYATLPIQGHGVKDFENLGFLIPENLQDVSKLQKAIVFFDDKNLVNGALSFLRMRLAPELRNQGIVRIFHSQMSVLYLEGVYADFEKCNSVCKIFLTTSVASLVSLILYHPHFTILYRLGH